MTVLGFSVGGWLALEMASKNTSRIARMALAGSVGLKFGGAYDRDIEDIYFHNAGAVRGLRFADPDKDPHFDLTGLSKRQAMTLAHRVKRSRKSAGSRIFTIRRCATGCTGSMSLFRLSGARRTG